MPKMTVEIRTDPSGHFSNRTSYNPPGPVALTVRLSATLLSPYATGLWGDLDIEPAHGRAVNQKRAFVAWQNEPVQLGSWHLGGGDNTIVVSGTTRPHRPNARLVLQIEATL